MQAKALIYRLGSLGDTILALPTLHALKNHFGPSNLTLLSNKPVDPKAPSMDEVLGGTFFSESIEYPVATRSISEFVILLKRLRARKFLYFINLMPYRGLFSSLRDIIFFKLSGINTFIGFNIFENRKSHFARDTHGNHVWEAEKIAARLKGFLPVDLKDNKNWDLNLSYHEKTLAEIHIAKFVSHALPVAFSIGTKVPAKDWGLDRWMVFFTLLKSVELSIFPIFFGVNNERYFSQRCLDTFDNFGLNLCGITNPRISSEVMRHCCFFVGHDSGPMHLASSVGLPCLAIFSGRHYPRTWFPKGSKNIILQKTVSCMGCNLDVCKKENLRCLKDIQPQEVLSAFLKILAQK